MKYRRMQCKKKQQKNSNIKTSKTILEKEFKLLENRDTRPSMVYDELVNTFDPFTTSTKSSEPLDPLGHYGVVHCSTYL